MQVTEAKPPNEVMPFSWDVKPKPITITPEDKEELMRMAVERAGLIPRGK